jgi:putative polyhydroxyalkanoate system protein
MATPLTIRIPHQLGRAEARRRIESGFSNMIRQVPGGASAFSERWDGDRLSFSLALMGQAVKGSVDVLDAEVAMEIELPGVLGMIAGSLKGGLQKAGQLLLTKK